ncbi:MAG: DUF1456 family protein [Saprospiraceae bacterium]
MDNNDILRRLRYTLNLNDARMVLLFELGGQAVSKEAVNNWLKKTDDPAFQVLPDTQLAIFLNGLITEKRGKKEGAQPAPETELNNNIILRKLKIAFDLKTEDIMALFRLIDKHISAHELTAFLRNPKQRQYRPCEDQYLRNFLSGLQKKLRP